MARFSYVHSDNETYQFTGINPVGLTFQRQSNDNSCWATCICNARSALLGESNISDHDILKITHPGFDFVGIHDKEIIETISLLKEKTGVVPAVRETFPTTDGQALSTFHEVLTDREFPALLKLTPPNNGLGHFVLVLALDQTGTLYLIYDPQIGDREAEGTIPETLSFLAGGLKIISFETLIGENNYVIPLRRN
jgi:hypothetical protein